MNRDDIGNGDANRIDASTVVHAPQGNAVTVAVESRESTADEPRRRPGGKAGRSGPPGHQHTRKHGSYRASMELKELKRRSFDRRTKEYDELLVRRAAYLPDLTGVRQPPEVIEGDRQAMRIYAERGDGVSTPEYRHLDELTRGEMLLDRLDEWIFADLDTRVISRKRKTLLPIITQRSALNKLVADLRKDLGLKKRQPSAPDLGAYIAGKQNGSGSAHVGASLDGSEPQTGSSSDVDADVLVSRDTPTDAPSSASNTTEDADA